MSLSPRRIIFTETSHTNQWTNYLT